MKTLIVFSAILAIACATMLKRPIIPITRFSLNDDNLGTYDFLYKTGNGISLTENGRLKNLGSPEGPVNVKSGSYSFIGDDGVTYTINWVADETGYRATGAHLPTPPPMPAELMKAMKA